MCGQWKQITVALLLCLLSGIAVHAQDKTPPTPKVTGNIVTLSDGYTFEADEVWKQGDELWYRKGNITQRVPQQVKSVKPIYEQAKPAALEAAKTTTAVASQVAKAATNQIWIHLVDGARFRVDEVQEASDGAWYSRHNVSIFLAKERIERIEYETPGTVAAPSRNANADWTSGNGSIDQLIRANSAHFGIDPYLVF